MFHAMFWFRAKGHQNSTRTHRKPRPLRKSKAVGEWESTMELPENLVELWFQKTHQRPEKDDESTFCVSSL